MNVLLIDDDAFVCGALKTILDAQADITVCATGSSGVEAQALYRAHMPDVLLMDIRMGGMDGITAGEAVLAEFPEARILYLTTFSDDEYVIKALHMGARGYLLKQDFNAVPQALRAVMSGQNVFGREVMSRLPEMLAQRERPAGLEGVTAREMALIEAVAEGLSNKEIAEKLFLGEGTVRNYLSIILEKLGLRDRTQLAIFYYTKLKGV